MSIRRIDEEETSKGFQSGILFTHRKVEALSHVTPWLDMENLRLREMSQGQKDKYHIVTRLGGI
jgi:hypothetical protein